MSKPSTAPYVVRWRDALVKDERLSHRAITAAMVLTLYADVKTGRNCYPGASACAQAMRVSVDTIHRGWAELVKAGWLELAPLPQERRRTQGALKILRWPKRELPADSGHVETNYPLTAAELPADSGPTIPGNGEPLGPSRPSGDEEVKRSRAGRLEGWTAAEERAARADGLVCSRCDTVVSFFPYQPAGSSLCGRCLEEGA